MSSRDLSSQATPWWLIFYNGWLKPWLQREDPQKISLFDRSSLFLFIVTGFWYFTTYLGFDVTPGPHTGSFPGWWDWFDQGQYYKTATEIANGELKPSVYWIGYPLLGAPFVRSLPRHPFFVPDLIMVLIMVGSFFASCRYFMGRLEAWLLIGFFIFHNTVMRDNCLIVPWNTMPAYAAIYLSVYLLTLGRAYLKEFFLCAFAIGTALLARPNELIPLGAIYMLAIAHLRGRQRVWALGFFALAGIVVAVAIVSLNFYFYGHPSSPYMEGESRKFSCSNMGLKLYQLLCDGAFLTGNAGVPSGTRTTQILERFPFFILLLPGAIFLARARPWRAWGLFLAILLAIGFYLTYNPFNSPAYFWTYGSFHYVWWIMPWLGFISYLSFRQAPFLLSRPTYLVALLGPVLIYLFVGFKAVETAGSDGKDSQLTVSTQYENQTYTMSLKSGANLDPAEDLRLQFQTPPSYFGSEDSSGTKVVVDINGAGKAPFYDYAMSQQGASYDFAFLIHSLQLKEGDRITIKFTQTAKPVLVRASLLKAQFSSGRAVARFFTP